jgi:hypothetical protein
MAHLFVILKDGILYEYDKYEDIPDSFDNVIKFMPETPDGPHTHEQHDEIDLWNNKLQELIKRETK